MVNTANERAPLTLDVLVIGAGQAGLATAYFLERTGLQFRIFDRAGRVGDSWRRRYASLVLFSTRDYDGLPGLPMPGAPDGYPGKDELADYLESYARAHCLPISMGEGIARLERKDDRFVAVTDRGRTIVSKTVIVATGAFQRSSVPAFASRLPADVPQLSGDSYKTPSEVPPGRVLVVGGGATGRQIARELAQTHDVSLSVGRPVGITRQRFLGRDVMVWFDRLGLLRADKATAKGRFVRTHESFPGLHLRSAALRRIGIEIRKRMVTANADGCVFADGTTDRFDTVVWCTGYRDDDRWLHIAGAVDDKGRYIEQRGISPIARLFHVGRSWQTSRASALLCGVGADAKSIVKQVLKDLRCLEP